LDKYGIFLYFPSFSNEKSCWIVWILLFFLTIESIFFDFSDSVDYPDSCDFLDSVDYPDSCDSSDSVDYPDSCDFLDSVDYPDSCDSSDSVDSSDFIDFFQFWLASSS
jgi:hypothetical protein